LIHRAAPSFWEAYRALPDQVRFAANDAFQLLKSNPSHPSLRLKKVGNFWSARIGLHHRALASGIDGGLLWFWIGSHADYDRLVR
jgi:hypothetical protein